MNDTTYKQTCITIGCRTQPTQKEKISLHRKYHDIHPNRTRSLFPLVETPLNCQ